MPIVTRSPTDTSATAGNIRTRGTADFVLEESPDDPPPPVGGGDDGGGASGMTGGPSSVRIIHPAGTLLEIGAFAGTLLEIGVEPIAR